MVNIPLFVLNVAEENIADYIASGYLISGYSLFRIGHFFEKMWDLKLWLRDLRCMN